MSLDAALAGIERDLAVSLNAVATLRDGLRLCVEAAVRAAGMDYGGVYLVDEASGGLDLAYHQDLPADCLDSVSHYDAGSPDARVVAEGKPVYARHDGWGVPPGEARARKDRGAVAVVPIRHENRALGCLNVASRSLDEVPASARDALETIAAHAGCAIVRLKAAEALATEHELLRSLMDNMPDSIYFKDLDSRFTRINRALADAFGLGDPSEAIGKTDADFFTEEHARQAYEDEQEVIRTGQAMVGKREKETWPGGRETWVSTTKVPLRDDAGRIIGTFGMSRNITERIRADQALRESEDLLRATLESTADGILVVDEKGRVTHTNARFAQMWGIPEKLIQTRDDQKLLEYVLDQLQEPQAFLSRVRELYKTPEQELDTLLFKDGRTFERYSCPLVRDGQVAGRVWCFRDITERKRAEEALRASLKEKEVLLREVHHRVKNNLQVISSLLSLQSRQTTDGEARRLLRESESRVRSMAMIHEDLVRSTDLSQIDFGEYARRLSSHLLAGYGIRPDAVSVTVDVSDVRLPIDTAVTCGLILNELVANALIHAFSPGQKGQIHIALRSDTPGQCVLSVRDNGVGIAHRRDRTNADSLGLQLVEALTEQLGGTLEIDTRGGTEVKITFADADAGTSKGASDEP